MAEKIYVNGTLYNPQIAALPINDRGLKFGDGVYETIRVENSRPFLWHKHMQRLKTSLDLLKIQADITDLLGICNNLIAQNKIITGTVRIMVTRGIGGVGYLPGKTNQFGLVVEALPLPKIPTEPIDLYLSSWRKIPGECLPPAAKTMQGLSSTLARMEAEENSCFESVLLSMDGHVCEGSSSNVFWVKDNVIYTPSLAAGILAGTTRDSIIELINGKVVEGIFNIDAVLAADEVFVTNVVWTVLPVKKLLPHNIEYRNFVTSHKIKQMLQAEMANCCA